LRFLFDNQLSPRLAEAINALAQPDGDEIIHLRKKFPPDTSDIEWLTKLGDEGGWIVVCGDLNIIRARAERVVWKSVGLIGFFLKKGWINLAPWDQAWRLVKWWPTIVAQAQIAAPGNTYGVGVNATGKLETL
jgi:hypothetical protein